MTDILYLISAICFIFALKGLSSADTAKSGNIYGIVGIVLACLGAYTSSCNLLYPLIAILLGGSIGIFISKRISMTQLPEMVAGFHSLVGLSALLIDSAAYFSPELFGIVNNNGDIYISSLIEIGLGIAIGAVTFTGSIIAFLKLKGVYKGQTINLVFNSFIGLIVILFLITFTITADIKYFYGLIIFSLLLGMTLIIPILRLI